jgi:hypothetical protein
LELELLENGFPYQEIVLETVLTREETLETIVPDDQPDIETVLHTRAHFCMTHGQAESGGVLVSGVVRCCVLYQPEELPGLCTLQAEVKVQCSAAQEQITQGCSLYAVPRVTMAETRTINPRKVLIRVGVAVEVLVTRQTQCTLAAGVGTPDQGRVEELVEEQTGSFVLCCPQRPFSYADTLTLPGSKPPMEELLSLTCLPFTGESHIAGGKLIFKGGVTCCLCYRSVEGEVEQAQLELPLAQVLDVEGASQQATFQLELLVTDQRTGGLSADGRSLEVELELLAEAVVRETKELKLLRDAYSTTHTATLQTQSVTLSRLLTQELVTQTARETVELPGPLRALCDTALLVTDTVLERGEGTLTLQAQCWVSLVYQERDGHYGALTRRLTASLPVTGGEGVACWCYALPGGVDAVETAGGVELRATVAFRMELLEQRWADTVTAITLEEPEPRTGVRQPSIVLRQVGAGESLWQIAKAYTTTRQEILEANGIEGEEPRPGALLLIPRKR